MKKNSDILIWTLIAVVYIAVFYRGEISEFFGGDLVYNSAEAGEVVLYSTAWCGYCTKTRRYLNRHNIPFQEFDIEKSDVAYRAFSSIGGQGVPVVTVGDEVVHGYNTSRIRHLLECEDCQ